MELDEKVEMSEVSEGKKSRSFFSQFFLAFFFSYTIYRQESKLLAFGE